MILITNYPLTNAMLRIRVGHMRHRFRLGIISFYISAHYQQLLGSVEKINNPEESL